MAPCLVTVLRKELALTTLLLISAATIIGFALRAIAKRIVADNAAARAHWLAIENQKRAALEEERKEALAVAAEAKRLEREAREEAWRRERAAKDEGLRLERLARAEEARRQEEKDREAADIRRQDIARWKERASEREAERLRNFGGCTCGGRGCYDCEH